MARKISQEFLNFFNWFKLVLFVTFFVIVSFIVDLVFVLIYLHGLVENDQAIRGNYAEHRVLPPRASSAKRDELLGNACEPSLTPFL